jgi:glucokinase
MLSTRLQRPVRVVNDLSAAAWGELKVGAAKGERHVLVVFVGSGVGSAIIANGQLVTGASGVAGEFGHIKVVRDGRLCGCGERGCLEAYAGGHNLIAQMQEALSGGKSSEMTRLVGGDMRFLTPAILEKAAANGDPVATDIFERAAGFLSLAVANQVTMLNPAHLILGGGVLMNGPRLRQRIAEAVSTQSSWVSRQVVRVSEAALGDDSGLIGAALLASEM